MSSSVPASDSPESVELESTTRRRKSFWQRLVIGLVSVVVSGGLVANLLFQLDFKDAGTLFVSAHKGFLLLAIGASLALPFCAVLRWKGVLVAKDIREISFATALRAVMVALVLNSVLPSKGGDLAKAFYVRKKANLSMGLGTVVVERLVDFFVLGTLGMVGYFWSGVSWGLLAGATLLGGVVLVFSVVLWVPVEKLPFPQKVIRALEDGRSVFLCWLRSPKGIFMTLAGSLLNWFLAAVSVCFLLAAFNASVDWSYTFGVFPLAILAGLLPLTVSGMGTRDSAFVAFFMAAGVSRGVATLVGLGYTLCAYWILAVVSLPVVFLQLRDYFYHSSSRSNQ